MPSGTFETLGERVTVLRRDGPVTLRYVEPRIEEPAETAIPEHGWATEADIAQRRGLLDSMTHSDHAPVRIAGMLGYLAAHKAIDALDLIADQLRRD